MQTRLGLSLVAVLLAVGVLYGQATKVISSGTLPATCSVGAVYVKTGTSAGWYVCTATNTWTGPYPTSSSGAPTGAQYWTGAPDAGLSAEKDLSALSTGLVGNTAGTPSAYGGTSCTNQFPRSLNASGAATCASVSLSADTTGTLAVGSGGTGLTSGTSGGVPYFSGSTTIASSAALTANAPVIGGGAGSAPTVGSRSGNTTTFATTSGTLTSGNCAKFDASGNVVDNGATCGTGGVSGLTWIAEATPSATGTLSFSSLGSYTHLEIRYSARSTKASVTEEDMLIRFNSDSGANYDLDLLYDSSATAAASAQVFAGTSGIIANLPAANATANRAGVGTIRIADYRGTTFNKGATNEIHMAAGTSGDTLHTRLFGVTWRDTSAITSVTLLLGTGNFVAGSKFTLYGLQ